MFSGLQASSENTAVSMAMMGSRSSSVARRSCQVVIASPAWRVRRRRVRRTKVEGLRRAEGAAEGVEALGEEAERGGGDHPTEDASGASATGRRSGPEMRTGMPSASGSPYTLSATSLRRASVATIAARPSSNAIASCEAIGTTGRPMPSAKARAAAIPTRNPVNGPGPIPTATPDSTGSPASARHSAMNVPMSSAWLRVSDELRCASTRGPDPRPRRSSPRRCQSPRARATPSQRAPWGVIVTVRGSASDSGSPRPDVRGRSGATRRHPRVRHPTRPR